MDIKSLEKDGYSYVPANPGWDVVVDNLNDGSILQYKRVSNYNEMDAQESFIIEQINNNNEIFNFDIKSVAIFILHIP